MFYLANDERNDRTNRFCWECGSDESPRSVSSCVSCGASLATRRFLISVRWDTEGFTPFARFFEKQLSHPGMLSTVDMFFQDGVLCAVTPWSGEALMVDEGAPLSLRKVLDLGQRTAGVLAFLRYNGVILSRLSRANFLVRNGEEYILFDPDVSEVLDQPVSEDRHPEELAWLGALLRRYTPVTAVDLHDFFLEAENGRFTTGSELGRGLERLIGDRYTEETTPGLGAMTDVGLCRVLNEDNWGWAALSKQAQLLVVADGMGGHDAGEVASAMAVETICRIARERLHEVTGASADLLENALDEAFQTSNNGIKDHSIEMGNDMGTTLVASLVYNNQLALVANVGDSRGYLLRQKVLHQVTRDHSLVSRMVEQGRLTPEEARNHPHSNILLRTVGTEHNVDIDIFRVELEPGDQLMLCSDGLWGEVEDDTIEDILNHYDDPRVACRELTRAAHHGGGKDNVTVMIYQVPRAT